MKEVIVIDYGLNNLLSVQRALEHCGVRVIATKEPDVILNASYVVLPGVGAFAHAMEALRALQLVEVIRAVADRGTPLLGICLGMQLLLTESEEFGLTPGLDLISGRVVPVPKSLSPEQAQKVPHIGWAELQPSHTANHWQGTLFEKLEPGLFVYFVHSFMAKLANEAHDIASCQYAGRPITAAVTKNNIMGCQFHPEKSGEVGLNILRQFLLT